MPKLAKSDVKYSDGMLDSHCGPVFRNDRFYCRHFIPRPRRLGDCELVSGGIDPSHWCELYKRVARPSS